MPPWIATPLYSAPALNSHHCCACQWAQELQKKLKSMIKKEKLEWKKKFRVNVSGSILQKNKKNYCDTKNKKQFTHHQSDSESLQFNERILWPRSSSLSKKKEKRPVTVALPYPPLLHQNEGKLNKKKSKSKAFFMFFQQHYKKRTNFSVFDDHIYARLPPILPFKPLRMNVKPPLLYWKETEIPVPKQWWKNPTPIHPKKKRKIFPPKRNVWPAKTLLKEQKRAQNSIWTTDRVMLTPLAITLDPWWNRGPKEFHGWIYFVFKKQCNSILLHWSVS